VFANQRLHAHICGMDEIDRRLLNLVQKDSRRTAEQLAEDLPLSPTAITRRLHRLRADGTIEREVALLGAKVQEARITAVIQLQFDRHSPAELAELKRTLAAAPEVQICVEITGTSDMLIIASTRDMAHFNELGDRIGGQPLVRRYETSFVKRRIKMSLAVELEAAGD
jgi:DNA-binding Lrp family transcriptional regulator